MSWQPIDTAPRDGTEILLGYFPAPFEGLSTGSDKYAIAGWHTGRRTWIVWSKLELRSDGHYSPTHWMPLPPPPESR